MRKHGDHAARQDESLDGGGEEKECVGLRLARTPGVLALGTHVDDVLAKVGAVLFGFFLSESVAGDD